VWRQKFLSSFSAAVAADVAAAHMSTGNMLHVQPATTGCRSKYSSFSVLMDVKCHGPVLNSIILHRLKWVLGSHSVFCYPFKVLVDRL